MFKKTFLILALLGCVNPVFVFADKFGIDNAAQNTNLIQNSLSVPELIGSIVGIALSFVGIVFFLLILYAGFLWMTAFGNDEKVTSSKSIMEHAVLGLIIVLSAYAISKFVFSSLPGGGGKETTTQNNTVGQACGTNMIYDDTGVCISKCSSQFPVGAGCIDNTVSRCSEAFKPNLCPGGNNIQCCAGQESEIIIDNINP